MLSMFSAILGVARLMTDANVEAYSVGSRCGWSLSTHLTFQAQPMLLRTEVCVVTAQPSNGIHPCSGFVGNTPMQWVRREHTDAVGS